MSVMWEYRTAVAVNMSQTDKKESRKEQRAVLMNENCDGPHIFRLSSCDNTGNAEP